MKETSYVACDLGASSGRVILGRLADGKLTLEEVHRFITAPVRLQGTLRWNVPAIFEELKAGLRKIARTKETPLSLSVDSWGIDYVLLNDREPMLSLPYHYRDARTDPVFQQALATVGPELIFAETGIQFLPINTLYQLIAEAERNRDLLAVADRFLPIADYLNFLFCGVAKVEESLASTTQLFNPLTNDWSQELIAAFDLPPKIFPGIVRSGTRLGKLLPGLREETGLPAIDVIATCSHDTGCSVAAVPATGDDWAFLSSGTWSLIGVELAAPLINAEVRAHNFTNERGYDGTTHFLKNIIGLWLLQECQRTWEREGLRTDYGELSREAAQAAPFRSLINPNAARFAKPDQMPEKIADFCRESGQLAPETPGQFVRCVWESLALLYRKTLGEIERLTSRSIKRLHIVGGGSSSPLLNRFTAAATGCTVLAGPVEATAAGNVLIQAITAGQLKNLRYARAIVRDSFSIQEFQPEQRSAWDEAAARVEKIDPQL